ncbi:hypothetical protein B0H98_104178 [Vreelandella songnenensis]|uniref:Uncharacterized protein n=1 Tax=Vreelandella songnenensis TaxID=1176243 RepID=A0A2T0V3Z0_9GAMM|nr:hypothetical protein [Halomonas songnenensis]PRY64874.1 hypothetical protein B0H98_104178 [Halomonas songnenensis]
MMIVELIDGDDFRARLSALGVDIPEDADPETSARIAAETHRVQAVEGLPETVRELMNQRDILLPAVRQAIERFLPVE